MVRGGFAAPLLATSFCVEESDSVGLLLKASFKRFQHLNSNSEAIKFAVEFFGPSRYHFPMRQITLALLGLIGLLLLPNFTAADEVDHFLQGEMQQRQIAGLALMVVKDGQQIKTEGYGLANLEWNVPVTKDTVFEIGSMTKQFTAACILLLAQDGKLSVDDKICQHLKNTPATWTNITIRHLLTHTS
ncbi:MAG: hypothetical protein JWR69_1395, partial [Pedosphaera sp.]|nr:hypothetical protein [Pedosphaera sp.]